MNGTVIPAKLIDAVVALEGAPHPSECEVYLEDGCTCGLDVVLARLYPIVGAGEAEGRVSDDHPLRAARLASSERFSEIARLRAALADDAITEALQWAWDEFATDTGCWPDAITYTRGPRLRANFHCGNYAALVGGALRLVADGATA